MTFFLIRDLANSVITEHLGGSDAMLCIRSNDGFHAQ
jgi:hypothetical protein